MTSYKHLYSDIFQNLPTIVKSQINDIIEFCDKIKPLLVISCTAYNHEAFLRDALEGFVMQRTDFPFVAVVHDDASTDGTAAVLREYAERYPDIILPIYEEENQYSKRDGSLLRVMNAARAATGAKYIALCEGDDYWTCPDKLQRQVDFLESHPDYSLVFHNAPIMRLDGNLYYNLCHINGSREYSPTEILKNYTIPTASVVYLRENIDDNPIRFNPKFKYGDNVLFLTAATQGKIFCIDKYWSVYRQQMGSMVNSAGSVRWAEICNEHLKELERVFSKILEKNLCKKLRADSYVYLVRRHRSKPQKLIKYLFQALTDVPIQFSTSVFVLATKKAKKSE